MRALLVPEVATKASCRKDDWCGGTGQLPGARETRVADLQSKSPTDPAAGSVPGGGFSARVDESRWEELLGPASSPPVARGHLDDLQGARILLTGAGGSIGSAVARSLVTARVERLVLLDSSEAALFQVAHDLEETGHPVLPVLGNVCDRALLDEVFQQHRPEIVVHAAAFKHVALVERNPVAAIRNNTYGSWVLAHAAMDHNASALVLISTDKAVNPVSAMGASKRAAELALFSLAAESTCRMNVIRLCNVIGSSGSVAPLLLQQVLDNKPVTVTHRLAARYFISMPYAVAAVLDVLRETRTGRLFAPSAAVERNILSLAEQMIEMYARGDSRPTVVFPGLQSGERLREKLIAEDERWVCLTEPAMRSRIREVVPNSGSPIPAPALFKSLWRTLESRDSAATLRSLCAIVPQYKPSRMVEMHCNALEAAAI